MLLLLAALFCPALVRQRGLPLRHPLRCAGPRVVRPYDPGGAGTPVPEAQQQLHRVRRTGFYHRVGALWSTRLRPFVVDRNIRHFLWYGGVAGDGLRSVGVSPPSKSVCSILPIAICGPGLPHLTGRVRGSGLYNACIVGRAAFPKLPSLARPSPCAPEALRRVVCGATMTTSGGAGTTLRNTRSHFPCSAHRLRS